MANFAWWQNSLGTHSDRKLQVEKCVPGCVLNRIAIQLITWMNCYVAKYPKLIARARQWAKGRKNKGPAPRREQPHRGLHKTLPRKNNRDHNLSNDSFCTRFRPKDGKSPIKKSGVRAVRVFKLAHLRFLAVDAYADPVFNNLLFPHIRKRGMQNGTHTRVSLIFHSSYEKVTNSSAIALQTIYGFHLRTDHKYFVQTREPEMQRGLCQLRKNMETPRCDKYYS